MDKKKYLEIRKSLELRRRWQLLAYFFLLDLAIIGGAIGLWSAGLKWCVFPVLSILMFRNFSLMHDATHGAVSGHKKWNDLVGAWSGAIGLLPYSAWRESHLQHHHWSGNLQKDPVMGLRVGLPKAPVRIQKLLTWGWRAYLPLLGVLQNVLFWKLSFGHALNARSFKVWAGVLFPVFAWAVFLSVAPQGFILKAFLPGFVLYMLAAEIVNLPHHLQLPALTGETRYQVWEQYKSARTCVYPKWFARHVVLNFNYHSEHHMFPDAPWYALEAIHEKLKQELGEQQNLDLNFQWTAKNRTLGILEVISPLEDVEKKTA